VPTIRRQDHITPPFFAANAPQLLVALTPEEQRQRQTNNQIEDPGSKNDPDRCFHFPAPCISS
jgi:hypothetical protein